MSEMAETINYAALLTGIASIILAIIAIWLAIAFKKQSDDINRDTTEKLARIEAFATTTKEDAFAELSKWGDFIRKGGMMARSEQKETLEKLTKELRETTRKEIEEKMVSVERKINETLPDVSKDSTIAQIKEQFQSLKKEIADIQQRNLAKAIGLEKEIKLKDLKKRFTLDQKRMAKALFDNPKITLAELREMGHGIATIVGTVNKLLDTGLMHTAQDGWVFEKGIEEILK